MNFFCQMKGEYKMLNCAFANWIPYDAANKHVLFPRLIQLTLFDGIQVDLPCLKWHKEASFNPFFY